MIYKTSILFVGFCFLCFLSTNGQSKSDTLFYEIQPEMIHQAQVHESSVTKEYNIHVQIKAEYREKYAQFTENNIGNFLAVKYQGMVIAPSLPTIQARIPSGRFQLGPYKTKEKATGVREWILGVDQ